MEPLAAAADFLTAARCPDGSLGYLPGQPGRLEPTLLAGAAGLAAPVDWLAAQPWSWGMHLLPAALADHPGAASLREQTVERLLTIEGRRVEDRHGLLGFDATIPAWPWVEGTAPWVEPTACALISLKRTGHGGHIRVQQGAAMLVDRQCRDGGWNYGNPALLGTELESYLPPTGWAAMALSGPPVARALVRLRDALQQPSALTLSLAVLAHIAHQARPGALVDTLIARQRPDGSFGGRCDWTALALCALSAAGSGRHAFAVPA